MSSRAMLLVLAVLAIEQGSVSGIVRDPAGLPVPSAIVVLNPPGVHQVTKEDGAFRFEDLARGDYTLEITARGFAPYRGRVYPGGGALQIVLRIADLRERLDVKAGDGRVSVETAENLDAILLDRELLEELPVMGNDVLGAVSQFLEDGLIGSGDARIVIDGVESRGVRLRESEIQEVRINKNPYSAEYSRPGSARIDVITRRASRQFHGELGFLLRDHRLDARNAFAAEKERQQRRNYEAGLTGPLGRFHKNTFVFAMEREEDDRQAVIFAQTLGGLVRQNALQPQRDSAVALRLNRYHSDRHSFSFRYSRQSESESGAGAGGFTLPEAGYHARARDDDFHFAHKWFARPGLLTELTVQASREQERTWSARPGERRIVVLDAFTAGGAQRDERTRETDAQINYVLSWTKGKHFVRTGVLVPEFEPRFLDERDNFQGTYSFASLADFAAGRPFSFTRQQGESVLRFSTREAAAFIQDDFRIRPNLTAGFGLRYENQKFVPDRNNVAPRASLAWGIGQKTVFRAGGGLFYDGLSSDMIADALRYDGVRSRQILITDPPYPEPAAGATAAVPPGIVRIAHGVRSPRLAHFSAGVERELSQSLGLAINYAFARGAGQFRSLDRNAPAPPDFERPDPAFQTVREIQSSAAMRGHTLTASVRGRIGGVFRGTIRYTLGQVFNDVDGAADLPPNSLDLSREWGRAGFDRRHRLRALGSLALPADLEMGLIFSADSGRPYEWTTGVDENRDGQAKERPPGVGRNALDGPSEARLDLRLAREFWLKRSKEAGAKVKLAVDSFNLPNRVNFTRIVGNQSSPFFRQPVAAGAARRVQLSIGLEF